MKTINITFTDKEFKTLSQIKKEKGGKRNWHSFIIVMSNLWLKVMKGGKDGKNKDK
jgi:hypothetical protein|tara:strand:- start:352 stop:519 length:168 start_codon:yes stop_codon:yes gene_type:complete